MNLKAPGIFDRYAVSMANLGLRQFTKYILFFLSLPLFYGDFSHLFLEKY